MSDTSAPEVTNEAILSYNAFFHFDGIKISAAGEYTCTGIIDDAMNSSFIMQSNKTVDSGSIIIKSALVDNCILANNSFRIND